VTLTLLSKPGCHLCEEVRTLIEELQPLYGFAIEETNITRDPELFARYRYEIPVLLEDGQEVARGRMTEAELVRIIARPR
jgi:hypothetical protein